MYLSDDRYPYISQNQDMIYSSQPTQYSDDYSQSYNQAPQYYQLQNPYQNYEDMNTANMVPWASSLGDPPPLLSNNPVIPTIVLFKELTAYPNYGNPSRNADILYTGNRGSWSFDTPAFLFVPGNLRGQMVMRASLDDHTNVPVNLYSLRITINDRVVHDGRVPLEHGTPVGGIFNNWKELTFNVPILRRNAHITIENTSNTGSNDWIGFDWMQMRLATR